MTRFSDPQPSPLSVPSAGALTPELLQEVKQLHFQTKKLANQSFVGSYRSAYRGSGMEFEEVREYIPGDDIRRIDWKVTARSRVPHLKSYREERELTVVVAVDVSASTTTGTKGMLRETLAAKVGALLALVALTNNDKVSLLTYSNKVESYHPARKSRGAVWRIIHQVLDSRGREHGRTDIAGMCRFLQSVLHKHAVIFLISDFIDSDYELALGTLSRQHDVTALTLDDPAGLSLPASGFVQLTDPETGLDRLVDCSDRTFRAAYEREAIRLRDTRAATLRGQGVGLVSLSTDRPYVSEMRRYFDHRERRAVARGR